MTVYNYKATYVDYNGYEQSLYVDATNKTEAYALVEEELPYGSEVETLSVQYKVY
jgi:hypothetical protein